MITFLGLFILSSCRSSQKNDELAGNSFDQSTKINLYYEEGSNLSILPAIYNHDSSILKPKYTLFSTEKEYTGLLAFTCDQPEFYKKTSQPVRKGSSAMQCSMKKLNGLSAYDLGDDSNQLFSIQGEAANHFVRNFHFEPFLPVISDTPLPVITFYGEYLCRSSEEMSNSWYLCVINQLKFNQSED